MNGEPLRPLAGLNIAITRPREQAALLAREIEQAGGHALLFPLIDIGPASNQNALRATLQRLAGFDWAIFISPSAVNHGMVAMRQHATVPANLKFACVGQGSARKLHEFGITGVVAPQDGADSEALLALPELQAISGQHILIFRGNGGRELLGDTLKARGAHVEYAECYERRRPTLNGADLLDARPDVIILTSSEALENLWALSSKPDQARLTSIPLFVIHERIAAKARQMGWQEIFVTAAGDKELLAGLTDWAAKR